LSVSVIIPAYNAAATICRAVESALGQTHRPREILVVDDGSPDSAEIKQALAPFGWEVTLLSKPNGGAASARNYGIDHACGEWLAFLDADDYWEPEKLDRQLAIVQRHPQVAVVGCRWYEQIPGQERVASKVENEPYCGQVWELQGAEAFRLACNVWTGSLLVRREALHSERFLTGLEPAEDRDLWVRLILSNPTYLLPDLLSTYVQEPGGISRTNIDRDCQNMLKVLHRNADLLGPADMREHQARIYRRWASVYLARGEPSKARPHALRRLRMQPASPQAWWVALKSVLARST
jgi:glycosyltransferase involved in cell wall biosynthesis